MNILLGGFMAGTSSSPLSRLSSHYRGQVLLETPSLNKGTGFTYEERQALGLDGLLPPVVETIEEQSARAYKAYLRKHDDLERHIYLRQLQDTNEVLFYRLLLDHIEEMFPSFIPLWLRWRARNSATSTGVPAACLFLIRFAITSVASCKIAPTRR